MKGNTVKLICHSIVLICIVFLIGWGKDSKQAVVLYCALDQIFSEPILEEFVKQDGYMIRPVFDTEATKTVGLVNRLIAEKNNPRCDVFWNNEIVRTIVLKRKGILQPYTSPNAEKIPPLFKDKEGYWTGFAARSRVLIYNKNMLTEEQLPKSIFELVNAEWKGKIAMALPLFGTTATHAAALFISLGDEQALEWYKSLKANDVKIVAGNAQARDVVVRGEYPIAFTDTDDAYVALQKGAPVGVIFPDQEEDGLGTLVIPNTVALIAGAEQAETGKALIDYLLHSSTEQALALCGSAQMPVRPGMKTAESGWSLDNIKAQQVDWKKVADKIEPVAEIMRELFVE